MTLFRNALLAGLLAIVPGCLDLPKWHDAPRDAGTSEKYDADKKEDVYQPRDAYQFADGVQESGTDATPPAQDAGTVPKYDAEKKEDVHQLQDIEHQADIQLDTGQEEHDARTLEDVVSDARISLPDSEGDVYDAGPADMGTPDVRIVPECVITGNLEPFYTGLIETAGRGECKIGERLCIDNNGRPTYVTVTPEVTPLPESCNNKDDDCDGNIDNGYDVGAACEVGQGICHSQRTKECAPNGLETRCNAPVIQPQDEICDNGIDENCDGEIDDQVICRRLIAYICKENDNKDVCLITIEGNDKINITQGGTNWNGIQGDGSLGYTIPVSWSPNRRKIAFISAEQNGVVLYDIVNETGERVDNTQDVSQILYSPTTGTKMVYKTNDNHLGILDLETGEKRIMTVGVTPAWFPNEQSFVYGAANSLDRIYLDGRVQTIFNDVGTMPDVSSNGENVLFINHTRNGVYGIQNGYVETGEVRGEREENNLLPRWFTDNQRFVFGSNGEVFFKTMEVGDTTNLTNNPARDEMPAVSPDGAYVVFVTDRNGTKDLYKVEVATGIQTRLTDDPGDEEAPVFAPAHQ
ncbi:MAG: hypothetical protein Q7R76_06620 [Candidatus Woesearchaeota archaeon]|nr:hypothetical protein [Candidatus Woesearchaeota archaeon]